LFLPWEAADIGITLNTDGTLDIGDEFASLVSGNLRDVYDANETNCQAIYKANSSNIISFFCLIRFFWFSVLP
jgi:hypothetical protein